LYYHAVIAQLIDVLGNTYLKKMVDKALNGGRSYSLRVDLQDWENNAAYAEYSAFSLQHKNQGYVLECGAFVGGNAGNITLLSKGRF